MLKSLSRTVAVLLMSVMFFTFGSLSAQASSADPGKGSAPSIIDEGSMLSPEEEASLTKAIIENHEKYGLFFVIETVPSLDGQSIESVALAHANTLGVGESKEDNGVLILLSRDDRKIRFELGNTVSGKISDAEMTNIIDSKVTPHFKSGNYPLGLESGMKATGSEYIGVSGEVNNSSDNTFLIVGTITLVLIILGFFISAQLGSKPAKPQKTYRDHEKAIARLKIIESSVRDFKHSGHVETYKTLANDEARFQFLQKNLPELAAVLQTHFSSETPSTILVDRSFYLDANTFSVSYTGDWSSVTTYALTGKGFEGISILEANHLIQKEKDIYLKKQAERRKIQEQERKEREKARKIWNSLPESTRQAVKKAKTKEDRMNLFASDEISGNFIAHYPLIASMFLSNSASNSSSSSFSNSSSSSSSSSSYDSGSFGGGSFDGGGGSGSW